MPPDKVRVNSKYISCAPNPTTDCIDWGYNDIVVFGSSQATVFYDKKKFADCGQVTRTLHASEGRVNSVSWIRGSEGADETEGVSGSSDGKVTIWRHDASETSNESTVLAGHTGSVTVVDGLYLPGQVSEGTEWASGQNRPAIVVSASTDSTVRLWCRGSSEGWQCQQTLLLGRGICLTLRLCPVPLPGTTGSLLLAAATDDARVRLFAQHQQGGDFLPVQILTGHEDWVRSLDFCRHDDGDLLLASGSQDSTIRLWRISRHRPITAEQRASSDKSQPITGEMEGMQPITGEIEAEEKLFESGGETFKVVLESVLSAHDGWVLGVRWQPALFTAGCRATQPMQLLSSGADQTLVLWTESAGLWLDCARMGDVGGNGMGLSGCAFAPSGLQLLGYRHALHFWEQQPETESWTPGVHSTGHNLGVVDLAWSPQGTHLWTAGLDQTTRIHAPWRRTDQSGPAIESWHEMARPQVHGHALSCLATLSRGCFASGSEEKVVRVFEPTRSFVETMQRLSLVAVDTAASADGASVPSLGLSNKAVQDQEEMREDRHVKNEYPEAQFKPMQLTRPPTEDVLLQNTLWPETQKLYGHGFEVYSLSSRPDGQLLVSGCKAPSPAHSQLTAWDTGAWQERQRLAAHALTVTQSAFSPDGRHLVSVSRDRTLALFGCHGDDANYRLIGRSEARGGLHSRVVWACAWTAKGDKFVTGSREGRVVVWAVTDSNAPPNGDDAGASCGFRPMASFVPDSAAEAVTALAFSADCLLAVGFGSGEIGLFQETPEGAWREVGRLDRSAAHHKAVRRLAFCPTEPATLASCGDDHAVKLHAIDRASTAEE